MATVYLALQNNLDRQVALKVMSPQLMIDPSFAERFLREAKIIAQLSHPHVIPIYDVRTMENHCYIAMEYQQGGELNDKIKAGLSLQNTLNIIKEIATALNFAHEKGYIHRDVKPANILFNIHGKSILSDFGVARQSDSCTNITAVGSVVGTPLYMSPEQVQGKQIDHRSDLYSLAIVLYEMLAGVPPYPGETAVAIAIKHMTEAIPLLPNQYAHLQVFINKALDKDPEKRYQTGTEFILALGKIESDHCNQSTVATAIINQNIVTQQVKSQTSTARKYVTKMVLVSLILLGTLATTGYLYFTQMPETENILQSPTSDVVPQEMLKPSREPKIKNPKDEKQEHIVKLLALAEPLMAENKLTGPEEPNAHTQYLAVLKLDQNNVKAKQGLRLISDYYLQKISPALQINQFKQAKILLELAKSIYPQHLDIEKTQNQISNAKQNYTNVLKKQADDQDRLRSAARAQTRLQAIEKERKELREKESLRKQAEREKQLQMQLEKKNLAKLREDERNALKNNRQKAENDRLAQYAKTQKKLTTIKSLLEQTNVSVETVEQAYSTIRQMDLTDQDAALINKASDWIIIAYAKLVTTELGNSNHDSAESILNKGLSIKNNDPRLLRLQSAIEKSRNESRQIFGGF